MATPAQRISGTPSALAWFGQFLKEELAPYAGRAAIVARMVVAATIVMIICMTFRLSFAFQGAIFALLVSRENSRTTERDAGTMLAFTGIGAVYLLVSNWFVISVPTLHLLWVLGSFFLAFYGLSILNTYLASVMFAVMIAFGVPFWDRHVPAERNVEDTLRLCLAAAIGIVVTVAVELVFSRVKPGDELLAGVAERLAVTADLLRSRAQNGPPDQDTEANVARLATVGISRLGRLLRRSNYSPHAGEQMATVIVLTGRLVDLAANLPPASFQLFEAHRQRMRRLAENIEGIRSDLLAERTPHWSELPAPGEGDRARAIPLQSEMEQTVRSITEAFAGPQSLSVYAPPTSSGDPSSTFFVRDVFSTIEHFKFGLKGCLTAGLCYVIYNATDWPGISTAVTTCLLTALTTIGSSRQKQVLRFAGAIVGGFVLAMGAQVFILPSVDSITGFTILFIFVTTLASWFMTSSSRLSYFGVQVALAYYLVHLQEFAIQSSLSIARDRVVGVLLGLIMMWLVFDQLWGAPAVVEMKKTFISALRLLAQFSREPVSIDLQEAIERSYSLRDAISKSFDSARAAADAVLFEFGPSRERNLAWRSAIKEWQPQLRCMFLTRIALWKYRAQLPGFELPETVREREREFDDASAKMLDSIADSLEGRAGQQTGEVEKSFERLQVAVQTYNLKRPPETSGPDLETFLQLTSRFQRLATSLTEQIRPPETELGRLTTSTSVA